MFLFQGKFDVQESPGSRTYTALYDTTSTWTYVGDVFAGEKVTIHAHGHINIYSNCPEYGEPLPCERMNISPMGLVGLPIDEGSIIDEGWMAGLIGKINYEEPFVIGTVTHFLAENTGPLLVQINKMSRYLQNDEGTIYISVQVSNGSP